MQRKKILLLLSSLLFTSMTTCVYATDKDSAAAANNTEASKQLNNGNININPQTGDANFVLNMPSFGGLDLAISYSNMLAQSNIAGNRNLFGLPYGVSFSGVPVVHTGNNGEWVLNIDGHDYTVDDKYASADNKGNLYYSGLRYQTSKLIQFNNYFTAPKTLVINNGGATSHLTYYFVLHYKNGKNFYFNRSGLCIAITDIFFESDQTNNSKHLTQITYQNNTVQPVYAKIKAITDSLGQTLYVKYNSGEISFTYPKNASGSSYQAYLLTSGNYLSKVRHSLNDQYDSGYILHYDANHMIQTINEMLFKAGSYNLPDNYKGDKYYQINYQNTKASEMSIVDMQNTDHVISHTYTYYGNSQNNFKYGRDTMMDLPNANLYDSQYQTKKRSGNLLTYHWYNYLHQEILTENKYVDNTGNEHFISRFYMRYPDTQVVDNQRKLLSYYTHPIEKLVVSYDQDTPISISKITENYNDYGLKTKTDQYPNVKVTTGNIQNTIPRTGKIDFPEYPAEEKPITESITQYDETGYLKPTASISKDFTIGKVVETDYHLSNDRKHKLSENTHYSNTKTGKSAKGKTITYSYASDTSPCPLGGNIYDASIICSEKTTHEDQAGKSVTNAYRYNTDKFTTDAYIKIDQLTQRTYQDTSTKGLSDDTSNTNSTAINGNIISQTDKAGVTTTNSYDVSGNIVASKTQGGIVTQYHNDYKSRRYARDIVAKSNNNQNPAMTEPNHIKIGEVKTDFLGNKIYEYSGSEKSGQQSEYKQREYHYDYTHGGRLSFEYDAFGNKKEYDYDNQGRVSKIIDYRLTNTNALEKINQIIQSEQLICDSTYGCYNKVTRQINNEADKGLISIEYIRGKNILYNRKELGNALSNTPLLSEVINHYTQTGVLESTKKYNSKSQLLSEQLYHYDVLGRVASKEMLSYLPGESTTAYHTLLTKHYDQWNDHLQTYRELTDYSNQESGYPSYIKSYDVLGRKISQSYHSNGKRYTATFDYDNADRMKTSADFNGNLSTHTYYKNGMLKKISYQKPGTKNTIDEVTYDYDGYDRLKTNSLNGNTIVYHYNLASLPSYHEYGKGGVTDSSIIYNNMNQISQRIDNNGISYIYHYLNDGRKDFIEAKNASGQALGTIRYEYYPNNVSNPQARGQIESITSTFNDGKVTNQQTIHYQYDDQGRPNQVSYKDDLGNTSKVVTQYDDQNRVIENDYHDDSALSPNDANMNKIVTYTYDALNRLKTATTTVQANNLNVRGSKENTTYDYDLNGNMKQQHTIQIDATGNQNNIDTNFIYSDQQDIQLTSKKETVTNTNGTKTTMYFYRYDNNGNLTDELNEHNVVIKHYDYNTQNQMIRFSNLENGEHNYHYSYYADGTRASKSDNMQTIRFYYYPGGNLSGEALTENGNLKTIASSFGPFRYLMDKVSANHLLETSVKVQQRTPKYSKQRISGEDINKSYDISGYGKLRDANQGFKQEKTSLGLDFIQNPFIEENSYYDSESNLEYMGARYYSPDLKRFMAQDSYDLLNRYIDGYGNPIMFTDPDGHMPSWLNYTLNGIGLIGGIAGAWFSGGSSLALTAGIIGGVSGALGLAAQGVSDGKAGGESIANALNIAATVTGGISMAADVVSVGRIIYVRKILLPNIRNNGTLLGQGAYGTVYSYKGKAYKFYDQPLAQEYGYNKFAKRSANKMMKLNFNQQAIEAGFKARAITNDVLEMPILQFNIEDEFSFLISRQNFLEDTGSKLGQQGYFFRDNNLDNIGVFTDRSGNTHKVVNDVDQVFDIRKRVPLARKSFVTKRYFNQYAKQDGINYNQVVQAYRQN